MWRELRWGDALRPSVSQSEIGRLLGAGVSRSRDPAPARGGGLVRGRWRASKRSARTGARAGRPPRRRDRLELLSDACQAVSEAGRDRRRGTATAGRGRIPYIFIAPADRLEIGRLARDVYKRHYAGIGSLVRDTNLALFGRIVNAERSAIHGELLSYLFLAREFIDELIALGRRDAERWLDAQHDAGLWQIGRLPTDTTESAPTQGRPRKRRPRATRT
jgi:hypothetical protein